MSRRKNGTLRAAKQLGINPYGWGNGRSQAMQSMKKARRRQPDRAIKKIYSRREVMVNEIGR